MGGGGVKRFYSRPTSPWVPMLLLIQKYINLDYVVSSSSNVHKMSVSQTGFIKFQGVFIRGEKVNPMINLSIRGR